MVIRFNHADVKAIFEPAKLFELLDAFQFARRKGGKFEQSVAPVAVNADVLPVARVHFGAGIANPGDRGARKIERVAVEIADYFHHVGIHDVVGNRNGGTRRGNLHGFVVEHGLGYGIHGGRIDQGLVTLDVDVDLGGNMHGYFRHSVGTGAMVGAGQNGFAAEGRDGVFDALVIGGNHNSGDAFGIAQAFNYVLNHRLASNLR